MAGATGKGVSEEAGVLEQIDYYVVTFSKAMGGIGGAVIARKEVARYLNWYAKCRMFSCALGPSVAAGVNQALLLAASSDGAARRKRIKENSIQLREGLSKIVNIGSSKSWIVPVIYGPEETTILLADYLLRNGMEGSVMEFPAVPVNEARVRLFVTSEHTAEHIASCVEIIGRAAGEFNFKKV